MTKLLSDIFLVLKPLCDSFKKDPDHEKAMQIKTLVDKVPDNIILYLSEPILFPITFHMKNDEFDHDTNLILVQIIRRVISRIKIAKETMFYDLYYCLRNTVCKEKNGVDLIERHEELKEHVVLCLKDVFKNTSISIIETFYVRNYAAVLSHGVYLCLTIAKHERSISLRYAALDALMVLLQVHDETDTSDIVLRSQISDVIMLFLPGVIGGLIEIAVGSDIQNHKITLMSVRVWSRTLALVMQDLPMQEDVPSESEAFLNKLKEKNPNDAEKFNTLLETMKKTPEWYKAASEKFKIIFPELDILTKHHNFRVRKELVKGLNLLILTCYNNMKSCFMIFLEMLITLSEDDHKQVAGDATMALKLIQERCNDDTKMKSAVEMLEENLYELLLKLPRIIRTSGETIQLVWLNRFSGYLKLLGSDRLSKILLSPAHRKKLLLTLVYIAEFDCTNVSLLEDITIQNLEDTMYLSQASSWKQYKFLFNTACVEKLNSILQTIGKLVNQNLLVDNILTMMEDIPNYKKEFTFILNSILLLANEKEVADIYTDILDYYINAENWFLQIRVSAETPLIEAQSNVIQCCLYLEGLSAIAKSLKDDNQFLLKTLYFILQRAGSENTFIRITALSTLENIAKFYGETTIANLLKSNIDYISYHVTMKLRKVDRNPGVLDVIEVVANYSTMDFLPHLKCIVEDVLYQSGYHVQEYNSISFLKVFYTFITCLKRLISDQQLPIQTSILDKSKNSISVDYIIQNIAEYKQAKENVKLLDDSKDFERQNKEFSAEDFQDNSENEKNYGDLEIKEPEIPYYIRMTESIMKRCLHYVSSEDFYKSSLAMAVLKEGALILKNFENQLLPLVHQLWHPLVNRFQSQNILIVNRAWQLLYCLVDVSRDFIRERTLKQVLPALSKFLKTTAEDTCKKNVSNIYKYTQAFKLQKDILSNLGLLVRQLKLYEKDVWDVLSITECYLNSMQVIELQNSCINLYKEVADYNQDLVWTKCIDIWHRKVKPVESEADFDEYCIEVIDCSEISLYQKNLRTLLLFIQNKSRSL